MWVKVCGMTNVGDVRHAVEAGADAIGIIVATSSVRRVHTHDIGLLVAAADGVTTVLVSAHQRPRDVLVIAEEAGFDWIQPHGRYQSALLDLAAERGYGVLAPVRVTSGDIGLDHLADGVTPLLDTHIEGSDGGSGVSFDWAPTKNIGRNFVLAGGLGPHNVESAIMVADPWGVDAVTMLESAPGIKDPARVTNFIQKAKAI